MLAYIAAVAAHPGFTARFINDLATPGLRIPVSADGTLFAAAAELGRRIIWLHTFGERMSDPQHERPGGPPRLPEARRPRVPKSGAISADPDSMPDSIDYDEGTARLRIGLGYVDNVEPRIWNYEISGKQVLQQWFSYRKRNRERPIIGDRRKPSPLGDIQSQAWLHEYTTELINLLNVLGLLRDLEPIQAELLEKICSGPLVTTQELVGSQAIEGPRKRRSSRRDNGTVSLFAD